MPAPDRSGRDPFDGNRFDPNRFDESHPDEDRFDDHRQDPALARALRDLDLPGPVVPAWSPAEVRERGNRRRTRRRATWAGAGLVAATLVGALIVGPLTPDAGGQGPAVRNDAASRPAAPPAPSPTASERATPTPRDQKAAPAATFDVTGQTLTTHVENGANSRQKIRTTANEQALKVLRTSLTLAVIDKRESTTLAADVGLGGEYGVPLSWGVVLASPDRATTVYVAAAAACVKTECAVLADYALVAVPDGTGAKEFFDAVDFGDTVSVTGSWDESGADEEASPATTSAPDPPATSGTTTKPSTSGNNRAPYITPTPFRSVTPRSPTATPSSAPPTESTAPEPTGSSSKP